MEEVKLNVTTSVEGWMSLQTLILLTLFCYLYSGRFFVVLQELTLLLCLFVVVAPLTCFFHFIWLNAYTKSMQVTVCLCFTIFSLFGFLSSSFYLTLWRISYSTVISKVIFHKLLYYKIYIPRSHFEFLEKRNGFFYCFICWVKKV